MKFNPLTMTLTISVLSLEAANASYKEPYAAQELRPSERFRVASEQTYYNNTHNRPAPSRVLVEKNAPTFAENHTQMVRNLDSFFTTGATNAETVKTVGKELITIISQETSALAKDPTAKSYERTNDLLILTLQAFKTFCWGAANGNFKNDKTRSEFSCILDQLLKICNDGPLSKFPDAISKVNEIYKLLFKAEA